MSFSPDFSKGNFIPENIVVPDDNAEMQDFLKTTLEKHARLINRKETAQYEEIEIQNNQTYPGDTPQDKRYIFRKVISLGVLATGVNTVAHTISVGGAGSTFIFTHIYGVISKSATPLWVSVPNDTILLTVDAANINITIPAAYNGFIGNCVLEYSKT